MKVLVTGMTTLQVGRHGQLGVTSFAHLLPEALRLAGHDVEQRPAEPGEPLGGYDAVLVGIIGPASVAARSRYRYGALDVIGRAQAEGCGLGLFLDDADLARVDRDLRYLLGGRGRLNSGMSRSRGHAWAEANLDHLLWVVDALAHQPWPTTVVARHPWGDPSPILDLVAGLMAERTVFLDPSALVPDPGVVPLAQAERRPAWVCSSLGEDQGTWLRQVGCGWPVERVGWAGRKLQQADLVQLYGEVAGCLVHPRRRLVGCGMWRHKLVHATRGGAVVCSDPEEVAELGEVFAWKPADVETLSLDDRQNLAAWQRYELESRAWPLERLVYEADQALKRVVAESSRGMALGV